MRSATAATAIVVGGHPRARTRRSRSAASCAAFRATTWTQSSWPTTAPPTPPRRARRRRRRGHRRRARLRPRLPGSDHGGAQAPTSWCSWTATAATSRHLRGWSSRSRAGRSISSWARGCAAGASRAASPGTSSSPAAWQAGRMRLVYGVRYTDMCAFRAIRRDALLDLGMREMTYGWNLEMQMRAARARACASWRFRSTIVAAAADIPRWREACPARSGPARASSPRSRGSGARLRARGDHMRITRGSP